MTTLNLDIRFFSRESSRLGASHSDLAETLEDSLVEQVLEGLLRPTNTPLLPGGPDVESLVHRAVAITSLEHEDCGMDPDFPERFKCDVPDAFGDFNAVQVARDFGARAELFMDFLSVYLQQFPTEDMAYWFRTAGDAANGAVRKERCVAEVGAALAPDYRIHGAGLILPARLAGTAPLIEGPAMHALAQRGWERVEGSITAAHREIQNGFNADAVTDVGTALEAALSLAGCAGKTLGERAAAAKKTLFTGTETKLGRALDDLTGYVAALRNIKSDAHDGAVASRRDAELALRIALSVITWLSEREDP